MPLLYVSKDDTWLPVTSDNPLFVGYQDQWLEFALPGPFAPFAPPTPWGQRPPDWLPCPIKPGEQKIGILVQLPLFVAEQEISYIFEVVDAPGVIVDWGDGSAPELVSNGVPGKPTRIGNKRQTWCIIAPQSRGKITKFLSTDKVIGCVPEVVVGSNTLTELGGNFYSQTSSGFYGVEHYEFLNGLKPNRCDYMFGTNSELINISDNIDTSDVTDFSGMFRDCSVLTNFPTLDTSSGVEFDSMFASCKELMTAPDLDTSNGQKFNYMFFECERLTKAPSYDVSKATTLANMFAKCSSLTMVPTYATMNCLDLSGMFLDCGRLATIPPLDTSNALDLSHMFRGCTDLRNVPLSATSTVTNFSNLFADCRSLVIPPLLDTSSGTDFSSMFSGCSGLTEVPQFFTSSGKDFYAMFSGCSRLTVIPALNMSGATSSTAFYEMFKGCTSLTNIEAYGFKYNVSVENTSLTTAAVNTLFSNLGTAAPRAKVNITGTPGAAQCDRMIAEAKGWVVLG
jgi:hypothetical protein